MSNNNYNYEIEKLLAKYGGEADKGITRTCGNCESYDTRLLMCKHADTWDDISIHKPNELNELSCYHHRTPAEQKRLVELVTDDANRLRLAEQRRNGTGDCAGCPFRVICTRLEIFFRAIVVVNEKIAQLLKKARG